MMRMPESAAGAATETHLTVFAGFPAASWTFALRVWLAVMLALYASFWLELEAPSTAAITVAIVALPTRGQGLEKAGYRILGTVLGVAISIAIAGVFSQTNHLLLATFSICVGLCAYAAAMLDGNRAYAAALCCITVALIAMQQIDSPQLVFTTGVDRGAAIAIGVLAIGLINDVLATPDYHPVLLHRLEGVQRQLANYVEGVTRGETTSSSVAGGLLSNITALRPEVASLATESSSGSARSAAARAAIVDMVGVVFFARALARLPVAIPASMRRRTTSELAAGVRSMPTAGNSDDQDDGFSELLATCLVWIRDGLLRENERVRESIEAMRAGLQPLQAWRAPLYRSRRIAAAAGVRAAIHFALASAFFVMTGWPAAEACLALIAVVIGLSSTMADPRHVITLAAIATPMSCLIGGILKYVVLDGASEFPLLAIGLAPFVIGLALLMTLPNAAYSSLARLTLVFTLVVLAPSNPQTYDPSSFLIMCFFVCLSTILLFAAQLLFPPLSNDRRLRQFLREARHELDILDVRRRPRFAPEEATFLDAGRIEQIVAASGTTPSAGPILDEAMRWFDQAGALRHCGEALDALAGAPLVDTSRGALFRREASAMLASAEAWLERAASGDERAVSACAALVMASVTFVSEQPATLGRDIP
jgi:uncharacterized membrane protein YccC